jgi:hypothetical protein
MKKRSQGRQLYAEELHQGSGFDVAAAGSAQLSLHTSSLFLSMRRLFVFRITKNVIVVYFKIYTFIHSIYVY